MDFTPAEQLALAEQIKTHFNLTTRVIFGGRGSMYYGSSNRVRLGRRDYSAKNFGNHNEQHCHRSVVIHEFAHALHHKLTGSTRKDESGRKVSAHGRFFFKCLVSIYKKLNIDPREHYWTIEYGSVYKSGFAAAYTNKPHAWKFGARRMSSIVPIAADAPEKVTPVSTTCKICGHSKTAHERRASAAKRGIDHSFV